MENPFVVLVEAIRAFDGLGIDYVVVGSIASSIHGEYRASGDVDIVADVKLHHVDPLVEKLRGEFYVDDLMMRRAISEGRSFNIIHLQVVFKIDIFIPATELGKQQLARREQHLLDSTGLQHNSGEAALVPTRARDFRTTMARRNRNHWCAPWPA
jgi:hypothetical protein